MRNIILLWIDDMENWASTAQSNLKIIAPKFQVNLSIIHLINGEDISRQCMMYNFDGVIMDYHMEPFNGDKYIHDIRNEEHLDSIPIIFYSQDNSTNLVSLVQDFKKIIPVYRPNLEDKIKEVFLLKK